MKGHLRQRGDAWELRAYAGVDPITGQLLIRTQILAAIGKVRLARLTTAQLDHFCARPR